jgi:hypothetical protein
MTLPAHEARNLLPSDVPVLLMHGRMAEEDKAAAIGLINAQVIALGAIYMSPEAVSILSNFQPTCLSRS